MGNDNKVTPHSIFLNQNPADFTKNKPYVLDEEFAKTKKNRNFLFYFLFILFLLLVGAGTFTAAYLITNHSKKFEIQVSDFEELNLKDILSASKKDYNGLIQARQDLSDVRAKLKDELKAAEEDTSKQLDLLKEKGLSDEDLNAQAAGIEAQGQRNLQAIRNSYSEPIQKKENEVSTIEKTVGQYDQKLIDTAKKSEQVLQDSQKLNDLEQQRQKKYYEDKIKEMDAKHNKELNDLKIYYNQFIALLIQKYNPTFTEQPLIKILDDNNGKAAADIKLNPYQDVLLKEKILTKGQYDLLHQKAADSGRIFNRLLKVPYTNSAAPSVKFLDYASSSMIQDYENLWSDLASAVSNKNNEISAYRFALDFYTKNQRENGFILDPRDPNSITVYLDRSYLIQPNDQALVFRDNNEFIGTIQFYKDRDSFKAKLLDMDKSNQIQPFDKFMLKMNQGE